MSSLLPTPIRDLARPEAYGGALSGPVEVRTTHGSWVFLVGDDVWKVKRPVDFGFLDFRLLAARRFFCDEEIRLNRRLSSGVYLGVDPIRATARGLEVGGAPAGEGGEIVDWAVHMRRLPDDRSAAALLRRGRLGPDLLGALAVRLGRFFAEAPPAPEHGTVRALAFNVDENFTQTEPFVPELLDRATFDEVRAFQTTQLARGAPFARRAMEGRIREGHGDLRLDHVYFLPAAGAPGADPTPVVIDCIEFNRRFRCGDVAAEVAFLAMELEAARRPDLAAGFLARFAEATDDFGLYEVLDFYLSYRAWVRGKVAGFVARDPATDAATRARKREEARRSFALSRACAGRPLDRPFLLVVGGVIGSGKSTLAAALGRHLAVPVIGSDRTRKALAGIPAGRRAPPDLYAPENIERTYREILRRAGGVLGAGRSAILDATFSRRRWRLAAAALAEQHGAAVAFIEARCSDRELLYQRLRAREGARSDSDARLAELEAIERGYEPPANDQLGRTGEAGQDRAAPRLVVDTVRPIERTVVEALRALRRLGILPARERAAS